MTADPWTIPTPQPVLAPNLDNHKCKPGEPRHACPTWGRLTSGRACGKFSANDIEPDPAKVAAREAAVAAAHAARLERLEAARIARAQASAAAKAENKRLKAELSEQRRAQAAADKAAKRLSPEELHLVRIRAQIKAQATIASKHGMASKFPEVKRVRPPHMCENRIAPSGMVLGYQAAAVVGCAATTVSRAIAEGRLECERKGKYTYVRVEDLRAVLQRTKAKRKEQMAKVREAKKASALAQLAPKPWLKLIKRERVEA